MCIALGKLSFEDCPLLTWSLGWTGRLPPRVPASRSLAIPAITSLTFMLVWVPLPVCHTASGNWSSNLPAATSAAAASIASAISPGKPCRRFTRAAACLMTASAWTISTGMRSRAPNGKFSTLRWVCAPQ